MDWGKLLETDQNKSSKLSFTSQELRIPPKLISQLQKMFPTASMADFSTHQLMEHRW